MTTTSPRDISTESSASTASSQSEQETALRIKDNIVHDMNENDENMMEVKENEDKRMDTKVTVDKESKVTEIESNTIERERNTI